MTGNANSVPEGQQTLNFDITSLLKRRGFLYLNTELQPKLTIYSSKTKILIRNVGAISEYPATHLHTATFSLKTRNRARTIDFIHMDLL